MATLGVGIIGMGSISKHHVNGYKRNLNVEINAICDFNKDVMARKKREFEIPDVHEYNDYKRLLERDDIDLVSICTPNYLHAEQAIASLKAGKHVLCEKPLCISMKECEDLVFAVKQSGLKLMIGQELRFVPKFQAIKKLLDIGEFGDLFFCESDYLDNKAYAMHGWRKNAEKVGSWLLEAGCHPIDLLRWTVGNITEVAGYSNRKVMELECPTDDCHVAILKFDNGCIGKLVHSAGCKRPYHVGLSIYGTRGTFNVDAGLFLEKMQGLTDFMSFPVPTEGFHPIKDEVEDFIGCVLEDRKPECDVIEGARTIATCLAIEQSIREKQFIPVKNEFGG